MGLFLFKGPMSDLSALIDISADSSGVETGLNPGKRSIASFRGAVVEAGAAASNALSKSGDGGKVAAKKVEDSTKNLIGSIQRQIAATEAGAKSGADYYRALANQRGVPAGVLKPYLDQLDAAKAKTIAATTANTELASSVRNVVGFLGTLGAVVSVGGLVAYVKSAIDAGDAFTKLSQKSGVAVTTLRELNYAASLSDVSTEALGTGLRKLSQNMAEAAKGSKEQSAAFAAIGVNVKGLDGNLKGADATLKEIAEKFAGFSDGPEKAALAIELFGKQGADLIPLLNSGASGLNSMAAEANQLGVVFGDDLAKNAEAFNDNLTRISASAEGARIAITGQLLPTLNNLAESFLAAKDGSSSFAKNIGGFVKTVIEAAVILYSDVAFVLQGVGREFGAVGAQIVSLGKLDIKGFRAISEAVKEDGVRAKVELDKFQFNLLNAGVLNSKAGAGRGTAADPRLIGSTLTTAPIVKAASSAGADAGAAAAKAADSQYQQLILSIKQRIALTDLELKAGRQLTDAEKEQVKILELLNSAKSKVSASQRAAIEGNLKELRSKELLLAVEKSEIKLAEEVAKARQAFRNTDYTQSAVALQAIDAASTQSLAGVKDRIRALTDEEEAVRISASQNITLSAAIEQVTIARLREKQAGFVDGSEGANAIAREIAERQKLATLTGIKEQREAFTDLYKSVKDNLTDALLSGFESGKGFAKSLRDTVVNMFKNLVLRPTIQGVIASVTGGASSLAGAATGGGGGLASSLSGISNVASSASSLFTAATGGGLGTLVSSVVGTTVSALSSAGVIAGNAALAGSLGLGAGSAAAAATAAAAAGGATITAGVTAAAGSAASLGATLAAVAGPVGIAIAAIALGIALFKKKGTASKSTGSLNRTFDADGNVTSSQSNFAIGNGAEVVDGLFATFKTIQQALGGKGGAGFDFGSYSGNDNKNPKFRLGSAGFDSGEVALDDATFATAASRAVLAALKASELPASIAKKLNGLIPADLSADQIQAATTQIIEYAGSIRLLDAQLSALPFKNLIGLSFDARAALVDLSGGVEQFTGNLTGFFQNFYSEAEQRQQKIKEINKATEGAGLDAATATRADFRAIFEALDLTTESGQKNAAALLSVQDAFASLTPAIEAAAGAVAVMSDTLKGLLSDRAGLEADILDAQGNASGAALARRAIATKGFTGDEVAAFDYNESLREQAVFLRTIAEAAKLAADTETQRIEKVTQERTGLQDQLNALTDTSTQALERQRGALDESNRALFDQVEALKKAAITTQERTGLQDQLNALTDTAAEALERQRNALNESNRALFDQVQAAKEAAAATAAFSSAMGGLSNTRIDLQAQLLTLQGNTGAADSMLRDRDIAQLIKGLTPEDAKTVTAQFDGNNALRKEIADLQTAQAAQASAAQAATQAAEQTAQAASALRSAMQSLADTLFDEVNRIRGLISGDSQQSLIQAQARFALNTVLARAGDQDAAKLLPTLSQTLLTIAEAQATSLVDLNRIRGQTAGSLEETAGQMAAQFGLKVPIEAPGTSVAPRASEVTAPEPYITAANSSNQQLLASLMELQNKMDLMVEAQERGNESTSTSAKMLQGQQQRPLLVEIAK